MNGVCGALNYALSVTPPAGGTASLITLPSSSVGSLTFAATSVVTDVGFYLVKVFASFASAPSVNITSDSRSYEYKHPCWSANIISNAFSNLTAVAGMGSVSQSVNLWYDSWSGSIATPLCGALNWYYEWITYPFSTYSGNDASPSFFVQTASST